MKRLLLLLLFPILLNAQQGVTIIGTNRTAGVFPVSNGTNFIPGVITNGSGTTVSYSGGVYTVDFSGVISGDVVIGGDLTAGNLFLTTVIDVSAGGTGETTFTDGGVLIGNGTTSVQVTTAGTAGQVLMSNGIGLDPTFESLIASPQTISAVDIDWSTGTTFTKTLDSNTTFTFRNTTSGQTIVVKILNTVGNFTVTWPSVSWPGGTPPVQTVGAKADIYTFIDFGGVYFGSVIQNF